MRIDPRHDALDRSPERLPPLASNVLEFPTRLRRVEPCNGRADQAVFLAQGIAILSESKCVHRQSKQLITRALAIRDRLRGSL